MYIPAQEVEVVTTNRAQIAPGELETLLQPSEESLRAELAEWPSRIDQWFDSLPKSSEPAVRVGEVVLLERLGDIAVREAVLELKDGTSLPAEIIYFYSSPEVWLVRALEEAPGVPKYSAYSWYGMHAPNVQHLSSEGELIAGTETTHTHPAQDLLSSLDTCQGAIEELEVQSKIEGTPQFIDSEILEFVERHRDELEYDVAAVIKELPNDVYEALIREDDRVRLGGVGPFNRNDLTFMIDGELQLDAVREACPKLMQIHDILKFHGFAPVLETELIGEKSTIPFLSLHLQTKGALEMVETVPGQPSSE